MKNLEQEYKNSQQEDMPDLWNRIETGLPEKKKPIPFLSVTRSLGIVAAAAALLLLVSLGLWSGRGSTEKSAPNQTAKYEASLEDEGFASYDRADMEIAMNEGYDMEEEAMGQITGQSGQLSPPMMADAAEDVSPQEMVVGAPEMSNSQTSLGSMASENAEAKDEMLLSEEEALKLLDSYLLETGVLPEGRAIYKTGEAENPGYSWEGTSTESGKQVLMFLEFYAYSEDGSCLIFRMGERAAGGDADVLLREYSVHVRTGAITEY
ncbi:MAG: hypothetical protein J1E65_01400 [Lachnospiraceae bacterium]|nr:hypothetical protein [Lachnospiraceae bacterium]